MKERLKNAPKPASKAAVKSYSRASVNDISKASEHGPPEQIHSCESIPDTVASVPLDSATHSICHPVCDDPETLALLQAVELDQDYAANDNLILPGDRSLVTDYVFFMMKNMRIAIPNASDYARGRRSTNMNSRLAGFCCKYCHEQDTSASASGRSFPLCA
jgi:hypothetical protein